MKRSKHIWLLVGVALFTATSLYGQRYPERRLVRAGNQQYERQNYVESEVTYRRALEKAPESYEANFNLGNALYKQERYDEAFSLFVQLGADTTRTKTEMAQSFYNAGNALFKQRKLEQALEAYKNSLRLNPNDREAKFNLAYTQKLLQKDQNNNGGGGNNQNQNNQNNNQGQNQNNPNNQNQNDQNNQNNQNNQNQNDPNQDQNNPNQDQNNNQQQNQNQNPDSQQGENPQPQGMSKEEADRMLEAVQMSEDKTREKKDAKKVPVVGRSQKNW